VIPAAANSSASANSARLFVALLKSASCATEYPVAVPVMSAVVPPYMPAARTTPPAATDTLGKVGAAVFAAPARVTTAATGVVAC
jgi:hypothetical protein